MRLTIEVDWLKSKQVCEKLGITYNVLINRTHTRGIYPAASVRNVYYWSDDQIRLIAMTEDAWDAHTRVVTIPLTKRECKALTSMMIQRQRGPFDFETTRESVLLDVLRQAISREPIGDTRRLGPQPHGTRWRTLGPVAHQERPP